MIPASVIGLFTGMLRVPARRAVSLVLGLTMPESAGTGLVVIAVLSVPTLLTHWVLGHMQFRRSQRTHRYWCTGEIMRSLSAQLSCRGGLGGLPATGAR